MEPPRPGNPDGLPPDMDVPGGDDDAASVPRFRLRPDDDEIAALVPREGPPPPPPHKPTAGKLVLPPDFQRPATGAKRPARGHAHPPAGPRPTVTYFTRAMLWFDPPLAILLGALAFLAVALTYQGFGHSWDEALYLRGATQAADWTVRVVTGDRDLLAADRIDEFWGARADGKDPLHPEVGPVPKLVTGLGIHLLAGDRFDPMTASRLPIALVFGLTVALVYWMGTRAYGRIGGTAAAVMYALFPRVFGHAHIAASETLLAFATLFTVAAFLASIRRWWLAPFLAVAFALALGTKVTALVLPIPLMLWAQVYYRRDHSTALFAMFLMAPLVLLGIWPWLWPAAASRMVEYVDFYIRHQSTAVFYLGQTHGYHFPPAPWHYPWVITAVSLPEWALLLALVGVPVALGYAHRKPVPVLFLLMALTPMALASLPNAPKYDGERLFFHAFPFIALLAGGGFAWLMARIARGAERQNRGALAMMGLAAIAVWGAVDLLFAHPNQLNFYNRLTGGARGAAASGRFETAYWGECVNEPVLTWLNENTRPGMKVKPLALNELAFQNLQRWGRLPLGVDFAPAAPPYDLVLMQVRQGFFGRNERMLFTGTTQPIKAFAAQKVDRLLVFEGAALEGAMSAAAAETTATETTPTAAPEPTPAVAPPPPDDTATTPPAPERTLHYTYEGWATPPSPPEPVAAPPPVAATPPVVVVPVIDVPDDRVTTSPPADTAETTSTPGTVEEPAP